MRTLVCLQADEHTHSYLIHKWYCNTPDVDLASHVTNKYNSDNDNYHDTSNRGDYYNN